MGHYDNCRDENCRICGQALGHCEHTNKDGSYKDKPTKVHVPKTSVQRAELAISSSLIDNLKDDNKYLRALIADYFLAVVNSDEKALKKLLPKVKKIYLEEFNKKIKDG